MITVDEIMSTDLQTLTGKDSLADAQSLMAANGFHHIPIVDDDNGLIGLVTHTDILAVSESNLTGQSLARSPADIEIVEFMTKKIGTVDERANLREAALFLQRYSYGCLPVVTDGVLVGIVTDNDFIQVAVNLLEQIELADPVDA